MEEIPQLMGARTSFVHLYVKDETLTILQVNLKIMVSTRKSNRLTKTI